jgi:Na+/H+-dicarboxylate symporter
MVTSPTRLQNVYQSATGRILLAMVLGAVAGGVVGSRFDGIGELGKVVIDLIKALAAPLLMFTVLSAFLHTRVKARSGALMVGISAINAALAVLIGLTISNVLKPGRYLPIATGVGGPIEVVPNARPIRILDDLLAMIPTNLVEPFRTNAIVSIVVLAVLGGLGLRRFKDEQISLGKHSYRALEDFITSVRRALELMLGWIVALLPLAVFAVMAQTVGTQGLSALGGLAIYLVVVILGLALHVGLVYQGWVVFVARMPLKRFWAIMRHPVTYAAGSSSSLATLPVTLRSLKSMGVSEESAVVSACIGTNLNNDGILLYEAMAALIVAQAFGIDLSLGQQLMIAATCVIASIGIAGVPEAGLISLSIVLASAKLPLSLLPLLLSVDWILGRCRAVTNVVGDVVGALVLDCLDGSPVMTADTELGAPADEHSAVATVN